MTKVFIANRGEIAVRIARAARELGADVQFVHATGEQPLESGSHELPGSGPAAYLDVEAIVSAALLSGADLVHPGYGFLSESSEFAAAVSAAGLTFIGPNPHTLELFGDKSQARTHAVSCDVPVLASTGVDPTLDEVTELLNGTDGRGVMVKAVAGGGGRGMRPVTSAADLASAMERCRSEAQRAFGNGTIYAEELMPQAKHVEVQVISDGQTAVAIGDRECSLQRGRQKVIEYAPCPGLSADQRAALYRDAVRLIAPLNYRGVATVEFLVDAAALATGALRHVFIEVNPRLQVEHTITEELTGIDIVAGQIELARGRNLSDLGISETTTPPPANPPARFAVQCRVNAEKLDGATLLATTGTITELRWPQGTRVDTYLTPGAQVDGTFDSLLGKVITTTDGTLADALAAADSALADTQVIGVETNIAFLRELLSDQTVTSGAVTTTFIDDLLAARRAEQTPAPAGEEGIVAAAMAGTVVDVPVSAGDHIGPTTVIATLEAMKMEHPITAGQAGILDEVRVSIGDQLSVGAIIATYTQAEHSGDSDEADDIQVDLDLLRPDLAKVEARRALTRDEARPEAVAKRHRQGHLTAREQITELVDEGSFVEYGTFPVAAQRRRTELDTLIATTPADGIITGVATINSGAATHDEQCAVLAYDYTVLAGTQGYFNHKKTDRILELAQERRLPVVFFTEGGGGRPGDVDVNEIVSSGLNVRTFATMGALSGTVPTVGVLTGRCFAGNAALLGCCDVVIATRDSNLGMAGPAMIEGGGLGSFTATQIGPMDVQGPNGVVDLIVEDDHEAIATARRYLSYFQGPQATWTESDQRRLRHAIGENRKHVYDIRALIEVLADTDSVLELRREFGPGILTALIRIEGRSFALVANDTTHLGGAIDADGADKMARFLQLADAHGLPVISLCDTPGFMVGPASEEQATVRHFSRLFIIGAHLRVPIVTIVLRKGYGLGAQAMAGGSFTVPVATVAWPSGEIGGMGLEGAVRLGYAKELAAIDDLEARERRFTELVDGLYEHGTALNGAMKAELDEVIDPADTRRWITATIGTHQPDERRGDRYVDAW